MRTIGYVEIDRFGKAARCTRCRKGLVYQKSMNPEMWQAMLQAFINRHMECVK